MTTDIASINIDHAATRALAMCADEINRHQNAMAWKHIDIGRELVKAREIFGPASGANFLEWAMTECGIGRSSVYDCIQAFEKFGSSNALDMFTVRAIVKLSRDSVPDEVRQQALERAANGERIGDKVLNELTGKEPPNVDRVAAVRPPGETNDGADESEGMEGVCDEAPEEESSGDDCDAGESRPVERAEPVGRKAKAKPDDANDIGERRFAVRSVVEQQTDGQAPHIRLNIADLLEDLAKELRGGT